MANFRFPIMNLLILILGNPLNLSPMEIYRENSMAIFYSNNDCLVNKIRFANSTQTTAVNSTCEKLSVIILELTNSLEENMERFCDIMVKYNAVAIISPPGAQLRLQFLLTGNRLAIPSVHFQRTVEERQSHMKINMIPAPKDNVPATISVFRRYSWTSVSVIYNSYGENTEAIMRFQSTIQNSEDPSINSQNIKFFQIISGLSIEAHTRQVAEILAKIKLSKSNKIVVYAHDEEVQELLSVGEMMQMTGVEHTWILPWQTNVSSKSLPHNSITLRPRNANKMESLWRDSCEVINRSFHQFPQQRKWKIPSGGCFDKIDSTFAEKFYRHVVRQSFIGTTGKIEFDDRGNRVNTDYEFVPLGNSSILWQEAGVQRSNRGKRKRKMLRAVTALKEPFVSANKLATNDKICGTGLPCKIFNSEGNDTTQFCCDGLAIELLHMLQMDLAIDIELHIGKDKKYGAVDPVTGQWSGMVGELIRDEADIAIADLTITGERSQVVDFTHPFMEIGIGVLVRVAQKDSGKGIGTFLEPVAVQLWIAVVASIFTMGALFWSMEKIAFRIFNAFARGRDSRKLQHRRRASTKFSIGASIHYSWSTVVRTRDKVTPPSHTSAKIGAIVLALCFLVFISTYTAQLAAFLVTTEDVLPIAGGIKDNKLQNPPDDLKVSASRQTSTETFFRKTTDRRFQNIWRHMKDNLVSSMHMGIEYLKTGKIDVYMNDYTTLVYHAAKDKDCALKVLGEPFFKSGYGIALQKNSTWTSILSQKILDYEKYDFFLTLAHRWLKNSCESARKDSFDSGPGTFRRMSIHDLAGLFLVASAGVILGFILLGLEIYYYKRSHVKRTVITRSALSKK